jgi:hypothetical protein
MTPNHFYQAGLGHVGSYQVAGFPYLTGSWQWIHSGSEDHIAFPAVTKSVTVISRANPDLRIHFESAQSNPNVYSHHHYVTLATNGASATFNVKCTDLYISNVDANSGSYEVMAELTGIARENMCILTGSAGIGD